MKRYLLLHLFTLLFSSIAISQSFDIYVCDAGNFNNPPWQILKFDPNGENPETFIDEELNWPQDIVFLEDQNVVLISNLGTGRITRYDSDNGDFIDDFANNIGGPTRMKIGKDSLLYVLQWATEGKVLRYELDGTFVDEYTDTGVTNGIGLDWDSNDNLYVSSYGGNFVRQYDSLGVDQGNFISTSLQGPTNIWFDSDGDLLANNWNGTTVKRFDSEGNFIEDFITGLSNPEGVAIYPNGDILIGNGGTSSVKLFDSEGNFIKDIIQSGAGNLILPNAVVLRENSTLAVWDPVLELDFLTSNFGSVFTLNPDYKDEIIDLELYDLSGNLLQRDSDRDDVVGDVRQFSNGMYIVKASSAAGQIYTQKIIVMQ